MPLRPNLAKKMVAAIPIRKTSRILSSDRKPSKEEPLYSELLEFSWTLMKNDDPA